MKKATKYRIVQIEGNGARSYVQEWQPGTGQLDHTFIWGHYVRNAHVFETREAAIEAAESIERRIVGWRLDNPNPARGPRNPVRIVPTTGGNWVEWTPSIVEQR